MKTTFKTVLAFLGLTLGLSFPALADVPRVNIGESGIAIEGYDPVAYFEVSKPVKGSAAHQTSHDGATYQFVSRRHQQLFEKNPAKYVPEYGGYCAFGMRYGQTSGIDPNAWDIVGGRLYLSLNHGTQAIWNTKRSEFITIADQLWSKLAASK